MDPATATPVKLSINAVYAIAPGQTVPFVATASMSDGTTQDCTRKVVWSAFPTSVLSIARDTGVATALAAGDVTIAATYGTGGPGGQAQITRTVLPPNTYRLTGTVLELRSEQEVRAVVADLNRRIIQWRRVPEGPPVYVPLVNADMLVSRWRDGQAPPPVPSGTPVPSPPPAPPRRWRRLRPRRTPRGAR